ncbi:proteasome-activating nucleotidase [Thermococcus onnurineus NA1]|uniref:Proteasome-activating nucleotidase n=1 Tax=Thermococcus onnurineus (strain NA1) TaxID=523850 RepID=PAN_THEON|nr:MULTISPECIES: proteasome-activating nucleotidase [Thermococcus]B6YXR2.1 RecName: Full=Proteasome-activating nucleotidase; Short=PAN; AltName: Full=Proteasomal ATPase; AltName: Full=Proteasome regulatory ATPase; AltName: Full=Proteasome regulatory particle [Thermococcus onnurineus NA1]ACJ16875.1 proteasome-activating nucleotidase [Thermococcus onnurineus NA1]NJE46787.1 AAA family ATPase [Thermococcus sp. GR7]NJE77785.1 AAA family ATPase [Thermococcus sp. GR4]NJF22913.1 AAA family ATPase [The
MSIEDVGIKPSEEYDDYIMYLKKRIRQLELQVRTLEADKERLERELSRLRMEMSRLRQPPAFAGTLIELLDEDRAIVQNYNGPRFVVRIAPWIERENLKPGARVALDQRTMAIVELLPSEKDPSVLGFEVIERPTVSYNDIGGLDKQLQELREAIELPLKHPELFEKVGIEPPKGVLLYGPPGCGKTLMAKALAHEVNATFIRVVGSELVRKFIGEGARLVHELFELAKEKAPAIIFIDEIDAIGAKRMDETTGGEREVNRTLMQLLAEMDGFDPSGNVKIIAATNRPDILDPALLRPGRFDRLIEVPLPNFKSRLEILKIHTKRMNLKGVDLRIIAEMTEGASGADLKAITMEAGMFAIRDRREYVTQEDFLKAIEKVLGSEQRLSQQIAMHEVMYG